MPHAALFTRKCAVVAVGAMAAMLMGGAAASDKSVRARGTRPVGSVVPNVNATTGIDANRRYKGPIAIQQKAPYHIIKVSYVPRPNWTVTMDVAGGVWTPWYCEFYSPTPTGQPPAPQRCIGIPKNQTALLKVRLDGFGPNAGKTAHIGGAKWGGACAGTAGDTCKLDMAESYDVTALTDGFL